jgi:hypothetical protein
MLQSSKGEMMMKSIRYRTLALVTLASSMSAFAATAPAKDDPPKDDKMSTQCVPADANGAQMADQHSKHDKKKEKKMKMKNDKKKEDDYDPTRGIYG